MSGMQDNFFDSIVNKFVRVYCKIDFPSDSEFKKIKGFVAGTIKSHENEGFVLETVHEKTIYRFPKQMCIVEPLEGK